VPQSALLQIDHGRAEHRLLKAHGAGIGMPKSNTLRVLGRVIKNPKKFASESRRTQQDLVGIQQALVKTQQDLLLTKQALADADLLISDLTKQLRNFRRDDDSTDRTRHLKAAYERHVSRLRSEHPEEEAMSLAVGGGFELFGNIELALLQHFGLRPDGYLIDVGCGSGRLAKPLTSYLSGHYSGFDVVADLVEYARKISGRSDWRFGVVDHIEIPERDGCADMVCFFSVLTHLMHEQAYWYLEEAIRVLKPGGKIVFSFLDFAESVHWLVFIGTLQQSKASMDVPINVFISKEMIETWSLHLNVTIEVFVGATQAIVPAGALGQSLCVLRKP
jgi:SAM-dependent methyltransferase